MIIEDLQQPASILLKERLEPSKRPIDISIEKEVIRAIGNNDVMRMRTLLKSLQHMYIYGTQKRRLVKNLSQKLNIH